MARSLAARTREAARRHPFLLEALAAGVVNYTAAARFLADELDDPDEEAVATALRRFGADLDRTAADRGVRVSMESGVGVAEAPAEPLVSVAGTALAAGAGEGGSTALLARGEVGADGLRAVLGRLAAEGVDPSAAGVAGGVLVAVVDRRDGATALRTVEAALEGVAVVESDAVG
jgi:hypothetical protein